MKNNIFNYKWYGAEIIEIHSNNYTAQIIPSLGGNLIKLSYCNEDILNTPKDLDTYKNAQNNYGVPHLFPPNRIKDGKFTFNGKEYQFPLKPSGNSLHGFLHNTKWKIEEQKQDDEGVSLKLTYESDEKDDYYNYYPHKFRCTREYVLNRKGLTENYVVENLGRESLPLSVGYHTAFPLREGRSERVKVSIDKRIQLTKDKIPTGRNLNLDKEEERMKFIFGNPSYDNMDNLYTAGELQGEDLIHGAIITGAHSKGDIVYEVDEKYKYWVVCNYLNRGDIICIEPQTSSIDAHNRADGNLITLENGKKWTSKNKLYIKNKKRMVDKNDKKLFSK